MTIAWTYQNILPTVSAVTLSTLKYIYVHFALHLRTKNRSENLKRPNNKLREVLVSFKTSNYKKCATVITPMSKLLNCFHEEQYLMEMISGALPLLNTDLILAGNPTKEQPTYLLQGLLGGEPLVLGTHMTLSLLVPLNLAISRGGKLGGVKGKLQGLVPWSQERRAVSMGISTGYFPRLKLKFISASGNPGQCCSAMQTRPVL